MLPSDAAVYGNLLSYKRSLRPMLHRLYGSHKNVRTEHQKNVHEILGMLATKGPSTTWDMAALKIRNDEFLRVRDRMYRRILVGRSDRGRFSDGLLGTGLVTSDPKKIKRKISQRYRLTINGILYCLDVLDLSEEEIDSMASHYASVLPRVFGRWDRLKAALKKNVYQIRILSSAVFLDGVYARHAPGAPVYELMSFMHTKYARNLQSISEKELAEQVSYWFYTSVLYSPYSLGGASRVKTLQRLLDEDSDLGTWYVSFVSDAKRHYHEMFSAVSGLDIK